MNLREALVGITILAGMPAAAAPAIAADVADRSPVLTQAAGQRGEHPRGPHFDATQGGGQQPHNPNAAPTQAGGPPAHFDATQGDTQQPHRPGASGQTGGPPAHFDSTLGDTQQPHTPGRGAPSPNR
ncbi:hypothetical protein [Siccirubricoccus phaeus]|uniref:hypothetical protein n=1 Tax=Siccirubricoccus phaeus TaxID=2595053 RepID=UPI0011F24E9A|nr:hypothetical protein [Siccirubricoccus phaeus]